MGKPGLGPRSPVWLGQGKLLKPPCLLETCRRQVDQLALQEPLSDSPGGLVPAAGVLGRLGALGSLRWAPPLGLQISTLRPESPVLLTGSSPGSGTFPVGATLTLRVAEAAAVAHASAAPPLHALQVLLVVEVALVEGRREVGQHRVKLAQRIRQVPGGRRVQGRGWGQGWRAQVPGRGGHRVPGPGGGRHHPRG